MTHDIHLERMAHVAFDSDGELRPFTEQLDDFVYGSMASGDQFVIAVNNEDLKLPRCPNLPLLMKQSVIRKITTDHEIPLPELKQLPEWLKNHPLAMDSLEDIDSIVVVADARDVYDRDIVIAIHLEKEKQQIRINNIASIYGKRNLAFLVENTFAANRGVYVNERTSDWILRTGVPFPEQIASRLRKSLYQFNPSESTPIVGSETTKAKAHVPGKSPGRTQETPSFIKDINAAKESAEAQSDAIETPLPTKKRNQQ